MRFLLDLEEGGYLCTPHDANLSLVTICTMHLLKAIPNAGPYLEYSIESDDYYPWQVNIYHNYPLVEDGYLKISDLPGWGIEPNNQWINDSNYKISE